MKLSSTHEITIKPHWTFWYDNNSTQKKYIQLQNNNKTENWAELELENSGARQTHTLKKALKELF